jgi:hypothetical protein
MAAWMDTSRMFLSASDMAVQMIVGTSCEPHDSRRHTSDIHCQDTAHEKMGVRTDLVRHAKEQAQQVGCYKVILNCAEFPSMSR